MKKIPIYIFYKHKYGDELLVDVITTTGKAGIFWDFLGVKPHPCPSPLGKAAEKVINRELRE